MRSSHFISGIFTIFALCAFMGPLPASAQTLADFGMSGEGIAKISRYGISITMPDRCDLALPRPNEERFSKMEVISSSGNTYSEMRTVNIAAASGDQAKAD